jgi:hypothetical protein
VTTVGGWGRQGVTTLWRGVEAKSWSELSLPLLSDFDFRLYQSTGKLEGLTGGLECTNREYIVSVQVCWLVAEIGILPAADAAQRPPVTIAIPSQ